MAMPRDNGFLAGNVRFLVGAPRNDARVLNFDKLDSNGVD